MNIGNKHLVINAVSIFLALALGLLIGLSMGSGNLIESQTVDVVSQIEEQFKYLKDENEKNVKEIKKVNDANIQLDYSLGILSGKLLENQLPERNVAILNLGNDYDLSSLKQSLEKSGANITSATTVELGLFKENNELRAMVEGISGDKKQAKDLYSYLGSELGGVLGFGNSSDAVVKLIEMGLMNFEGDYNIAPDSIVITGGTKEEVKNLDAYIEKLFEQLRDSNKIIVGVQQSKAKFSILGKYKEFGFSTVSNADTNTGKVGMILALKNHQGNYGSPNEDDVIVPDVTLLD